MTIKKIVAIIAMFRPAHIVAHVGYNRAGLPTVGVSAFYVALRDALHSRLVASVGIAFGRRGYTV